MLLRQKNILYNSYLNCNYRIIVPGSRCLILLVWFTVELATKAKIIANGV